MARSPTRTLASLGETDEARAERRKELYDLLGQWHTAAAKQAEWRAKELELRNKIGAEFFADAKEGTNTLTLDYGKVLKFNSKVNRSVVREQYDAAKALATAGKDEAMLTLLETVIKLDPSVVIGEYKKLDKDALLKLADIITEKPGTPELSIETPK